MKAPARHWSDLSTADFAALDRARAIAVLPVAATEQHGPHLPLSVDTDLVNGVIAAALPHIAHDLPALFLPTQAVGFSPEHTRFAGTLTLKADTVLRLWTEIGECVAASGVKKLVLLNAHGGQVGLMDLVARDLRARLGMLVYSVNWFNLPLTDAQGQDVNARFSAEEHRFGIHAGEIETAMMLALRPERVRMDQAEYFRSTSQDRAMHFPILGNGRSAKLGWMMQDYNANGAVGNAGAATAANGHAVLDAAGRALAQLLVEIDRLPPDTLTERTAFD
ncbi:MAG: creatininase family protein [Hydrogenophaga sp.]|jgi:creatinine amidohydrolase|uniref:creatininase family protein n=1 Tax=Hydrogenophaga sp. TaxID=1904254 RepID=UPI0008C8EA8C|nr:creatininase family protein [Hydrogenophaga sp.]MBU4181946.1 creatininase family protein [Gammaproteobacteria bacterium]OGB36110.1 MAG: creatininase [Burkholderiales bacterium RIFCSPLOWO2_02_FULL_66_35]PKO75288.1 MAG: creatininase [Betaproteobacteria bacterium HGW-Betaproteobacteria-15]MBU4281140.1 creatininase family protein [Gammaproteobacteria bacterium]MBU4324516.1 creatininase family protein [Gammaproteobacteria bacterium]